jgi:nucleoid-associated protein YgaU
MTEYTVQSGDTLSKIAEKFYGDGSETSWRKIYEVNSDEFSTSILRYVDDFGGYDVKQ